MSSDFLSIELTFISLTISILTGKLALTVTKKEGCLLILCPLVLLYSIVQLKTILDLFKLQDLPINYQRKRKKHLRMLHETCYHNPDLYRLLGFPRFVHLSDKGTDQTWSTASWGKFFHQEHRLQTPDRGFFFLHIPNDLVKPKKLLFIFGIFSQHFQHRFCHSASLLTSP